MLPPRRRSITVACRRCNRKKVRCAGGDNRRNLPCDHCRISGSDCSYPPRERNVTIPESYLRALQIAVADSRLDAASTPDVVPAQPRTPSSTRTLDQNPPRVRFVEDTTADAFVAKIRTLAAVKSNPNITGTDRDEPTSVQPAETTQTTAYDYFPLISDRDSSSITLKLPPYPYAVCLVDQFEAYMGFEYHWYLRKDFRERLDATYTNPESDSSRDRTWLCRLLVVLALGETYNSHLTPWIELGDNLAPLPATSPPHQSLPGVRFFEQAMSIFKTPCEDANVDHVEALNLIAFYSFSLDRRRSAYIYAGLSMRIASSLMLRAPSTRQGSTPLETEHHRRLWWTTYLLDAMTGAEMGINSAWTYDEIKAKVGLPSDLNLSEEGHQQLGPAHMSTAYISLCSIRSEVISLASSSLFDGIHEQADDVLRRIISALQEWRASLSDALSFTFTEGIPSEMLSLRECRGLASLYLRFHHCFIILLRPVMLRSFASAISGEVDDAISDRTVELCSQCLTMARHNLSILDSLRQIDRIAKFGFWESLHLFSSLKIILMANVIDATQLFGITYRRAGDDELYKKTKRLLEEMAHAGNLAAQGHVSLLKELERMRDRIAGMGQTGDIYGQAIAHQDMDINTWLDLLSTTSTDLQMLF